MKTTFQYDHYYGYEEISKALAYFTAAYPDLCRTEILAQSEKGRSVYAVTLTSARTGDALTKPAFYMDGNIHAGEVTGSMTCMHLIDWLLTNYGHEDTATHLLDTVAIYVLPRISPDGAESYLTTDNFMYSVDRDWKEEAGGIAPADLDGDGAVRMMRIPDPYGNWKKSPDDDELMVLREPDEQEGTFYSVFPEGAFEEYEGDENLKLKKMKWGMNFNRNLPFGWYPDYREPGAGEYPLSFPEVKAVHDFILAHPNIGGISAMHTTAGMILFPPGTMPEAKGDPEDMKAFRAIGAMGTRETGYPTVNVFDAFLADQENYSSGALDDWAYQSQGIVAYTVELWNLANRVGMPEDMTERLSGGLEEKIRRFAAYRDWIRKNAPEAFEPWHAYDHPKFGPVEIGGYNYKFTQQNPPAGLLLQECEKITRFMTRFARCLPHLAIEQVSGEKVSDDTYRITAVIGNRGFLPTSITSLARRIKVSQPVQVSFRGGQLISGHAVEKIENLDGYSRTSEYVFYGQVMNKQNAAARKKLTWIIKAQPGDQIEIHASQIKAGHATASIILK